MSVELVTRFLERRAVGDVEACLSLVADRATWRSPVGSPKHGREGFREALEEAYAETRWFATETLGVRPSRDGAVGKVRNRGERNGDVLDSEQLLVFRVSDEKIVELSIYVDDHAAISEFWSG